MTEKKKAKGGTIRTEAIISEMDVRAKKDVISFGKISFSDADQGAIREIIKSESPILLTITAPGLKDKEFPPIEVQCSLKNCMIEKGCDKPNIPSVQVSSGQAMQIYNYIKGEQKVKLKIVQVQKDLPFEEDEKQLPGVE